jgi:hypothetical protein
MMEISLNLANSMSVELYIIWNHITDEQGAQLIVKLLR